MMHIVNLQDDFFKLQNFIHKYQKKIFNEFKIQSITLINIWNDNINYKIIDSHCAILSINTINNEQSDYNLTW